MACRKTNNFSSLCPSCDSFSFLFTYFWAFFVVFSLCPSDFWAVGKNVAQSLRSSEEHGDMSVVGCRSLHRLQSRSSKLAVLRGGAACLKAAYVTTQQDWTSGASTWIRYIFSQAHEELHGIRNGILHFLPLSRWGHEVKGCSLVQPQCKCRTNPKQSVWVIVLQLSGSKCAATSKATLCLVMRLQMHTLACLPVFAQASAYCLPLCDYTNSVVLAQDYAVHVTMTNWCILPYPMCFPQKVALAHKQNSVHLSVCRRSSWLTDSALRLCLRG